MKKLEKLTLKELEDSAMVIHCIEDQKSIVAGSGEWITGSDGQQYYVEMDPINVHPGTGNYGTVTDFMSSNQSGWLTEVATALGGLIPGVDDVASYLADQMNQQKWSAATQLDSLNYNNTAEISWYSVDLGNGNGFDFNYYDGNTGQLLFTNHMTSLGYFSN